MAIFHFSVQVISRSKGRSCVAAAAYRAGEKMTEERTGLSHDYTKKAGVIYKEILAPNQVPEWVFNREQLWNQVNAAEKRKDAQTAREINIALPKELTLEENLELVRTYVNANFVKHGMIADIAIHMNDVENPHTHVMLTTRSISMEGFEGKNRDWNRKELLEQWREQWQEHANQALEKAQIDQQIDHRSHQARGLEQVPTIHEGPAVIAMEQKGIITERGEWNREAKEINARIKELTQAKAVELQKYKELKEELQAEKDKWYYFKPEEKRAVLAAKDELGYFADMSGVQQKLAELSQTVNSLTGAKRNIESAERPFIEVKHLLDRIDQSQAEINRMGFKDRHFGIGKLKAKQIQADIKQNLKQLSKLGFANRKELQLKWTDFKVQQEAQFAQIEKSRAEIEKSINIFKAAEKAFTMAEIRQAALPYRPEITPRAFMNLTYDEAKAINDLNREMGRTVQPDEMRKLAGQGQVLLKDSQRLAQAAELVKKHEAIQDRITTLQAPVEKAKRLVNSDARSEYQYLLKRMDEIHNHMTANGVTDGAGLHRQEQTNQVAMSRFPLSGSGFLKAMEIINRAAHATERVQNANQYMKLEREKDVHKKIGRQGHEYER